MTIFVIINITFFYSIRAHMSMDSILKMEILDPYQTCFSSS